LWNEHGNVGLVVGATDPEALARVRALAPDLWFLVPGIGAQGGEVQRALNAGLREDRLGMVINVSRAVAASDDPAEAAKRLRDEIRSRKLEVRNQKSPEAARSDAKQTHGARGGQTALQPPTSDLRLL